MELQIVINTIKEIVLILGFTYVVVKILCK